MKRRRIPLIENEFVIELKIGAGENWLHKASSHRSSQSSTSVSV
jgi:hypothetical protein